MWAAACIARLGSGASAALPDLAAARSEMKAVFDTGDGRIEYARCIDGAVAALDGRLAARDNRALRACAN